MKAHSKPNLLIIGATGSVANAVLLKLVKYRGEFGKLVLLSKKRHVSKNKNIDHKKLRYLAARLELRFPEKEAEYHKILRKYRINIVLDLSTLDSAPIYDSTNKLGISYINTAMGNERGTSYGGVFGFLMDDPKLSKNAHILCTGMNPGIVNMWVRMGIAKHGVPNEIVHFEYDTSIIKSGWKPMITWSVKEFIEESSKELSKRMLNEYDVRVAKTNALMNREGMKHILSPIMKLKKYPSGFVVPHEESASIARKYNVPSKFVYAINMKTMDSLTKIYKKRGKLLKSDLILGDNVVYKLGGADNIGVLLDYNDKVVYYFNSISNDSVTKTNATCTQVAIGVLAGLLTMVKDGLKPRTYFVEDLYNTDYKRFMIEHMDVQKLVFKKTGRGLKMVENRILE